MGGKQLNRPRAPKQNKKKKSCAGMVQPFSWDNMGQGLLTDSYWFSACRPSHNVSEAAPPEG